MKKTKTTLCIVHKDSKVLLGMKKRGFGKGRWNGFGGKIKKGESIKEAAKREVKEEAGIKVKNLNKIGIIDFEFKNTSEIIKVFIFKTKEYFGEPTETEEMNPKWFHVEEIPFKKMWSDDVYWFPLFLKEEKFTGKFLFGENDIILKKEINKVNDF